jgi:hypothetical protein
MEFLYGAFSALPRGGVPWAWHESQCRGEAQSLYDVAITGAPVAGEPASAEALRHERAARDVALRAPGAGTTVEVFHPEAVGAVRRRLERKRVEQAEQAEQAKQAEQQHPEGSHQQPQGGRRRRRLGELGQQQRRPLRGGGDRLFGGGGGGGGGGGEQGGQGTSAFDRLRGMELRDVLRYARDAVLGGAEDGTRRTAGRGAEVPAWGLPGLRAAPRQGLFAPPVVHR